MHCRISFLLSFVSCPCLNYFYHQTIFNRNSLLLSPTHSSLRHSILTSFHPSVRSPVCLPSRSSSVLYLSAFSSILPNSPSVFLSFSLSVHLCFIRLLVFPFCRLCFRT